MYIRQTLAFGAAAPGAAREALEEVADDRVSGEALTELRLIVSELVTNAVRHGTARGGAVELLVTAGGGTARVEVTDGGGGFDAPVVEPEPHEPGGWGLVVVDRLASRWGVEGGRATRVWAELPLETNDTSGGGASESAYARNV